MRVGILKFARFVFLVLFVGVWGGVVLAQQSEPWSHSQLLEPQELSKTLKTPSERNSPVLIQVGFQFLFKSGHIPGSIYVGPAKDRRGLSAIRAALKDTSRTREIVIYCGCCPFRKCPNVRPAFRVVQEMGFKNIKVLHLREGFEKNWMARGYPATR